MAERGIRRIAVIGAESTGKTALCEGLAKHFNTVWVPEYAREYFNDSDIYDYTSDDLVKIAKRQLLLEEEFAARANRFLFCDTTLITLKIWAELEFEEVPEFISRNLLPDTYAHFLVTDNSIPWVQDELRQNKFSRDMLLEMNINEVKKLNGRYTLVSGKAGQRLNTAIDALGELFH